MKTKFYTRLLMVFSAIIMFTFNVAAQETITVYVTDDFDNMEETVDDEFEDDGVTVKHAAGYMDDGSSDLELCTELENLRQLVGVGFRNVQIPMGATVSNAYVQFTSDSDESDPVTIEIYGVADINTVLPITDVDKDLSNRPKTTAAVMDWSPAAWATGDRGDNTKTSDISAIINEIVSTPGWAPGNNIMILFTAQNVDKVHREGVPHKQAVEGGNAENAPALVVTYSTGTAVNQVNEFSSKVYPNPAQDVLNITNPSADKFSYAIYSITGKLISSRDNLTGTAVSVDMSGFAKGMYLVDVKSAETTETHKLMLK